MKKHSNDKMIRALNANFLGIKFVKISTKRIKISDEITFPTFRLTLAVYDRKSNVEQEVSIDYWREDTNTYGINLWNFDLLDKDITQALINRIRGYFRNLGFILEEE